MPAARRWRIIDGDRVPVVRDLGPTSFAKRGPFRVGEVTLKLPTNDAAVEVWYPTLRRDVAGKRQGSYDLVNWLPSFLQAGLPDGASVTYPSGGVRRVPVAQGRFPLVVFSHGYAGFRTQSSFLTSWLASWGFVVAAPDHLSRNLTAALSGVGGDTTDVGDLRATISLLRKEDGRKKGRFSGHVDTSRVAALGHSAGGRAVTELAAADRRVMTFLAMAGASSDKIPRKPGLVLGGDSDGIVELGGLQAAYQKMRAPKRMVVFEKAGHHAFSDLCEVGASDGGLLAIAELLGVPVSEQMERLATDGCVEPAQSPRKSWPAIRQVTVAQLRVVFGFDRSRAGLSGLPKAFPGVVASSTSAR